MPKYRSKYEQKIAKKLKEDGIEFRYEPYRYELYLTVNNVKCPDCNKAGIRKTTYTPDFILENGVIIEAKGQFTAKNRKTALAFVEQYPEEDYRILFMADNRLNKNSKTRYSDWCNANGITFAVDYNGNVPKSWYSYDL